MIDAVICSPQSQEITKTNKTMNRQIWTLLFDIDGTLMRTQGAGLRAIQVVMAANYGVHKLPSLKLHGCTDRGIWQEIFTKLEIPLPDQFDSLIVQYCETLQKTIRTVPGSLLPGVIPLLERFASDAGVSMGNFDWQCQSGGGNQARDLFDLKLLRIVWWIRRHSC